MQDPFTSSSWQALTEDKINDCPDILKQCLTEPDSLTHLLNQYCAGGIELKLNHQDWQSAAGEESELLEMQQGETAFVREIQLNCQEKPWVFARSVIPQQTYNLRQAEFSSLGLKPLGEVLFSDQTIQRKGIEICRITAESIFSRLSCDDSLNGIDMLWCRRSVFLIEQHPLLVSEVFLPELYLCQSKVS